MATGQNNITNQLEEDFLKKRIMKKIYMRWLLTKKLPQVFAEVGVISFLVFFAQSRVSFFAVFKNAYAATDGPSSLVQFFTNAMIKTTPSVKMLVAILGVLGVMIVRDIYATRKYNPLSTERV